jgi:hypothetical protein
MIDALIEVSDTPPAKMVWMHGTNEFSSFRVNSTHYHNGRQYNAKPGRYVEGKSYKLGLYPKNVIVENGLD